MAQASMNIERVYHAACNVLDKHLVVAGSAWDKQEKKAERYDIKTDSWENLPDMNCNRDFVDCCSMGSSVFIFFGMDRVQNRTYLNTIEVLDTVNIQAGWRLIETNSKPCIKHCVAALNNSEILIFGG